MFLAMWVWITSCRAMIRDTADQMCVRVSVRSAAGRDAQGGVRARAICAVIGAFGLSV